ncbi:MAG: peptidoglycan -binding protein, partial [Pseudomonadota bacterium]
DDLEARRIAEAVAAQELRDRLATIDEQLSDEEALRLAEEAAKLELQARLQDLETRLSDEEAARLADAAAAEALRARLADADAEITAMQLALEEQRREAEETLTLLAAARTANSDLLEQLDATLTEEERRDALLATANIQLSAEQAKSAESLRQVEALEQSVAALRAEIGALQAILGETRSRAEAAEIELQSLGSELNVALAQVAAEQRARAELEAEKARRLEEETARLEAYRSEFFGRLREVLENREGVRIEGDRFVFSSEVLFEIGDVELSSTGKSQIARVARILEDVAGDIPPEIEWVVRVDGHTDNVPLSSGGKYADNWELSQGRALSVVRFLIEELGFPPQRLIAAGFGEYQPINPSSTAEARAQNRRIELKLTEK